VAATSERNRGTSQRQFNIGTITSAERGDMTKTKASISHDKAIIEQLRKSSRFANEYLKAALEESDEPRVLLVALRQIAEARGGIAKVAKAAGIERESLYRALSPRGNPRLSTLMAVTRAIGMKLTVEAA
jgi:probable addiction module antidote protein